MKLFIWQWQWTLQDYTSGMVVVLANDLEEAVKKISEQDSSLLPNMDITKYNSYELSDPLVFYCRWWW